MSFVPVREPEPEPSLVAACPGVPLETNLVPRRGPAALAEVGTMIANSANG